MGVGITGYVLHKELDVIVKEQMMNGLSHWNQSEYEGVTKSWNSFQEEVNFDSLILEEYCVSTQMGCCGVVTYLDWKNSSVFTKNGDTGNVPLACCRNRTADPNCFRGVRKEQESMANKTVYTAVCQIDPLSKTSDACTGLHERSTGLGEAQCGHCWRHWRWYRERAGALASNCFFCMCML